MTLKSLGRILGRKTGPCFSWGPTKRDVFGTFFFGPDAIIPFLFFLNKRSPLPLSSAAVFRKLESARTKGSQTDETKKEAWETLPQHSSKEDGWHNVSHASFCVVCTHASFSDPVHQNCLKRQEHQYFNLSPSLSSSSFSLRTKLQQRSMGLLFGTWRFLSFRQRRGEKRENRRQGRERRERRRWRKERGERERERERERRERKERAETERERESERKERKERGGRKERREKREERERERESTHGWHLLALGAPLASQCPNEVDEMHDPQIPRKNFGT